MTEMEKREAGMLYNNNYDQELIDERLRCQAECRKYNDLPIEDLEGRQKQFKKIVKSVGDNFFVEQPFRCDYGYNLTIGEGFYSNYNLVILDEGKVTIGDYVFIAPDCGIYTAGHPINAAQRNEGLEYAKPITIGSHVWIGGGVKIMPGVTIGSNVVIGAGSVVNKDIPDGVIAAGVPCKVIKPIAEEDQIK
ncbi:MAG: sugar O-acetyltransferase [Firmicutes bacterium]|nr:sugar O-acetyltransferase [Bacillota bacterium]